MFYGSNLSRNGNPHGAISNAAETPKVLAAGLRLLAGGVCIWLTGLPRRAGARMHAMTDAEARWWHWQVTERRGGLVHQYRDARFDLLRRNPAIRRDELRRDPAGPDLAPPPAPGSGCAGDR